jgi:hypothetical protein
MQRYTIFFINVNALHVSGGFSAHHQELKTVHTASGICHAATVGMRTCIVICVLVFTVFCIIYTVFFYCFVYVYLLLFVLSVLV